MCFAGCTADRCEGKPSLLVPYLLNQNLPRGFLQELATVAHSDPDSLTRVFRPILYGLGAIMRTCSLDTEYFKYPLAVLSELCELKVGNLRPVCKLVSIYNNIIVFMYIAQTQSNIKNPSIYMLYGKPTV